MNSTDLPPIERKLGRFELVQKIATGGMAEIFLASERGLHGLDRVVVIKRILPHLAAHENFVDMFLNEARVIARLNHPNIVQIYELGEQSGKYFIAMEYVPGASFRDIMRKAAKRGIEVPIPVAMGLIIQACAGAHAAHELTDNAGRPIGLVHRDISPHNLMVTGKGHVKLLDFGIAKATEMAIDNTRTGALKGKVHYMSPEQCEQVPLDRRSDIFALGIVLWELLTARRLFKRDSELSTMRAIVSGESWDPMEFRPQVHPELSAVVAKALAVDRDARYATADEMRRALIDAAGAADLKTDPDAIEPFVEELVGDSLKRAQVEVQEALERTQAQLMSGDEVTVLEKPLARMDPEGTGTSDSNPSETLPRTPEHLAPGRSDPPARPRSKAAAVFVVVALLAAVVVGAVLYRARNAAPVTSGPVIRIGWPPTLDPVVLERELEPLRIYLERETHRPVEFVMAGSYGDLSEQLITGKVSFASLPPFTFVQAQKQEPRITALAIKESNGSAGNDGVLLAREGAGIATVEQVRGKTVCVPDMKSTTGYLFPRRALRHAGIDPDKDVTIHVSGNHHQLLRDMIAGKCDVGGTYSGNYLSAQSADIAVARLRQLAVTGRAPNDALVAGPQVSKEDRDLVGKALLRLDPKQAFGASALGKVEKISGFSTPSPSDFREVRAAHEELLSVERRVKRKKSKAAVDRPGPTGDAPAPPDDQPKSKPKKKKKRRAR